MRTFFQNSCLHRYLCKLTWWMVCAIAASAIATSAVAEGDAENISYQVNYRNPDGYWNSTIRAGEQTLDEMIKNDGLDNILNEFSLNQLRETAAFARYYIQNCDDLEFKDRLDSIDRSMLRLTDRETSLKSLRRKINEELVASTQRWDKLITGTSIEEQIGIALGKLGLGIVTSTIFQELGTSISSNVASKLATGVGKAVGPISVVMSVANVITAAVELGDLDVLLPRLLEMTEIVAYLDVLLKQYDVAISAQEDTVDALWKVYDENSNADCKKNQGRPIPLPLNNSSRGTSEPNRACKKSGLSGGVTCVDNLMGD